MTGPPGERELSDRFKGLGLESGAVPEKPSDSDELARFRREWEAEVKQSQAGGQSGLQGGRVYPGSNDTCADPPQGIGAETPESGGEERQAPIRLMRRAVLSYAQAVESERRGELDEALTHYRKAFRLDPSVDRLFERASSAIQAEVELGDHDTATTRKRDVLIETREVRESLFKALNFEDFRYRAIKQQQEKLSSSQPTGQTFRAVPGPVFADRGASMDADPLSTLIHRLSVQSGGERNFEQIHFEPLDEEQPLPIARLPEEVLLHILGFIAAPRGRRGARIGKQDEQQAALGPDGSRLVEEGSSRVVGIGVVLAGPDYMSVEQLGRACWKFRLLTRAWSVWRLIVRETYFPPQIPLKQTLPTIVAEHNNDWRTTFVEQPRLRLNGAYIAACHYTRPGMHEENVWVRVVHVVEFYRSLRFLPDGRTLSLLTTDSPNQTVRKMDPSLRVKGFAIGRWTLHPQGLVDDEVYSRPTGPKVIVDDLQDKTMSRYTFRIILKLDKTSRGKWNRLEILEYESVNLESGEVCPLPLNHKKPFHFSTVRSYGI